MYFEEEKYSIGDYEEDGTTSLIILLLCRICTVTEIEVCRICHVVVFSDKQLISVRLNWLENVYSHPFFSAGNFDP